MSQPFTPPPKTVEYHITYLGETHEIKTPIRAAKRTADQIYLNNPVIVRFVNATDVSLVLSNFTGRVNEILRELGSKREAKCRLVGDGFEFTL